MTKNMSTPTNPPCGHPNIWLAITATTAIALSPWMSGRKLRSLATPVRDVLIPLIAHAQTAGRRIINTPIYATAAAHIHSGGCVGIESDDQVSSSFREGARTPVGIHARAAPTRPCCGHVEVNPAEPLTGTDHHHKGKTIRFQVNHFQPHW
jgi:hypothetical protein